MDSQVGQFLAEPWCMSLSGELELGRCSSSSRHGSDTGSMQEARAPILRAKIWAATERHVRAWIGRDSLALLWSTLVYWCSRSSGARLQTRLCNYIFTTRSKYDMVLACRRVLGLGSARRCLSKAKQHMSCDSSLLHD